MTYVLDAMPGTRATADLSGSKITAATGNHIVPTSPVRAPPRELLIQTTMRLPKCRACAGSASVCEAMRHGLLVRIKSCGRTADVKASSSLAGPKAMRNASSIEPDSS